MCILIVLAGFDVGHPLLVAGNRDERRDRPASPPGIWVGAHRRVLSPRDRRAGGTWLAIDDCGRIAGITNIAGIPPVPDGPSRGLLPHLALDQPDLEAGVDAVVRAVRQGPHSPFQLVLADRRQCVVVRLDGRGLSVVPWTERVLVVTNEHGPGELQPRGLPAVLAAGLPLARRVELLEAVLRDRGGGGHHAICKHGEHYGTVSSSVVAVPAADPAELVWRYAPGPPDSTAYRNYGNLGVRLGGGA
jgi:uncharacterized protein with NRDE domain